MPVQGDREFSDALKAAVQEALHRVSVEQYVPPLHFVVLGVNGSAMVMRGVPGEPKRLKIEMLAQYTESEGWRLPLTVMVVDSEGSGSVFMLRSIDGELERVH